MAAPITKFFRERRYGDLYGFRFVRDGDFWTVYCMQRPPNSRFSTAPAVTHIFADNHLCIDAKARPRSFEQAVARAWKWLSGYSTYIRTGKFPDQKVRVITPDYNEQGQRV